jgi:hypothetical protein
MMVRQVLKFRMDGQPPLQKYYVPCVDSQKKRRGLFAPSPFAHVFAMGKIFFSRFQASMLDAFSNRCALFEYKLNITVLSLGNVHKTFYRPSTFADSI